MPSRLATLGISCACLVAIGLSTGRTFGLKKKGGGAPVEASIVVSPGAVLTVASKSDAIDCLIGSGRKKTALKDYTRRAGKESCSEVASETNAIRKLERCSMSGGRKLSSPRRQLGTESSMPPVENLPRCSCAPSPSPQTSTAATGTPTLSPGGLTRSSLAPTICACPLCVTPVPTYFPTYFPTRGIEEILETASPSESPTDQPTSESPTTSPTDFPTTLEPTVDPTASPSESPTDQPTKSPTTSPTDFPTTLEPTVNPTASPSESPTDQPTKSPSTSPTETTPIPTILSSIGSTPTVSTEATAPPTVSVREPLV